MDDNQIVNVLLKKYRFALKYLYCEDLSQEIKTALYQCKYNDAKLRYHVANSVIWKYIRKEYRILGLDWNNGDRIIKRIGESISIYSKYGDKKDLEFINIIEDKNNNIDKKYNSILLEQYLDSIPSGRDKDILLKYYGIGYKKHDVRELSSEYNMHQVSINRIIRQQIKEIRK